MSKLQGSMLFYVAFKESGNSKEQQQELSNALWEITNEALQAGFCLSCRATTIEITHLASLTNESVISGSMVPFLMSWHKGFQYFSKNLRARMKPEAKIAPTPRTCSFLEKPIKHLRIHALVRVLPENGLNGAGVVCVRVKTVCNLVRGQSPLVSLVLRFHKKQPANCEVIKVLVALQLLYLGMETSSSVSNKTITLEEWNGSSPTKLSKTFTIKASSSSVLITRVFQAV
ncbi:hypothetical protein JHK85_000605 [Glycine max]|nr:hypothetical protein JHK85_000605 [Glycine max]